MYQLVDENHVITNRALYCTKNNELTTIINPVEYILTEMDYGIENMWERTPKFCGVKKKLRIIKF